MARRLEPDTDADPLQTLTSGLRKEVRGGSLQAHVCAVTKLEDISRVMEAFQAAAAFQDVASWSYGYRFRETTIQEESPAGMQEGMQDGIDEGCGEKILGVLKRASLQGLLLVVSRWQDHGAPRCGLEVVGLELYGLVVERCKDLLANIKKAMGGEAPLPPCPQQEKRPLHFDFSFLPPLPEPRVTTKYGPNHFLYHTSMNKPRSLPSLGGGDVRLWMANDEKLRQLPESELWALRSIRQPDARIEKVLHAVALLRQESPVELSGAPAARWGHLLQVLRSPTLRTELLLFDARSVSLETAHSVVALLDGMQVDEVRRANPGAAALFEWAQGVARHRCDGPQEEAKDLAALKVREAELSVLPKAAWRSRLGRRCKVTGFDRSRSAALLGMTIV